MLNIRLHLIFGLVLISLVSASPGRAATLIAAPTSKANSPAAKLREGEAFQKKGENAKAGEAYRQALESFPQNKQRANEGAVAADLSADAYWRAFEQDLDVLHLQAALDVLSLWLTLTGPQSRASMLVEVELKFARIRAIRDPLGDADAALAAGDVKKAVDYYDKAVDALANPELEARIILRVYAGCVAASEPKEASDRLPELRALRDLLVGWKGKRSADAASEQGAAVDDALADVEARIAQAEQELADVPVDPPPPPPPKPKPEPVPSEDITPDKGSKQRTLAFGLLAGGVVAMSAGAGLVGEGIVANRKFESDAAVQRGIAETKEAQDTRGTYDYDRFLADDAARTAENRRRTLGMTIGGSVLAAGGLAMTIYGIVKLVQGRRGRGSTQRARIHPGPFLVTVEF